jgi:hypothetical protein
MLCSAPHVMQCLECTVCPEAWYMHVRRHGVSSKLGNKFDNNVGRVVFACIADWRAPTCPVAYIANQLLVCSCQ